MQINIANTCLNKNNAVTFNSNVYSVFTDSLILYKKQSGEVFVPISLSEADSKTKKQNFGKNLIKFAGFIVFGTVLFLGAKTFIQRPTKEDLKLISFLEKKLSEARQVSESLKNESKKIYENNAVELKRIFDIPNSVQNISIEPEIKKMQMANTVEQLLNVEDDSVINIYRWYNDSVSKKKDSLILLDEVNILKNDLLKEIQQLKKDSLSKIDKMLNVPDDLRSGRKADAIINSFKEGAFNQEQKKISSIEDYVTNLFQQDVIFGYNDYTDKFNNLVSLKNNSLNEILGHICKKINLFMLVGNEYLGNITPKIPENIVNNPFLKFVQENAQKSKTPLEWMNFINNSMGKELSYKDIELLEKRYKLRQAVYKLDDKLLKDMQNARLQLFKFFKSNAESKGKNINFDNMSNDNYFEITKIVNLFKEKYGVSNLSDILYDINGKPNIDLESVLFKIQRKINEKENKFGEHNSTLIDRNNNFFEWDEILKLSSIS